jgi:hypothetical protein
MTIRADARRVSVAADRLGRWLDGFADRHGPVEAGVEGDVVAVRAADGSTAWIEVPFPPLTVEGGRMLTSLTTHVRRPRRVGVLLVRRGGYAAGVFLGAELLASKVGSPYVQSTTKAGGWSQQRYARRRDNQARAAFGEAAEVAARVLLPELASLEALVCGGDHPAVQSVLADGRLAGLGQLPRGPWLAVGDPRLRVLRNSPALYTAVTVHVHP